MGVEQVTELTPDEIAAGMDGRLREREGGRLDALLPSPCIQNHAAFLSMRNGSLDCLWFGGSLEGKSDISIWRSTLSGTQWSGAERLSDDPDRSEQNPVQFIAPGGREFLLHTAQPGGDQDACLVFMREPGGAPRELALPRGTFIRGPMRVRADGCWLLPVFHCVSRPGERWTGSHDTAALAISADEGESWRMVDVPGSIGCVHMTLVDLGGGRLAAFYRRRQADHVCRSESADEGESWSAPEPTDVPNNNSSISAIALKDGRVAMACNPVNAAMYPGDRRASLYDELGADERPAATGGCNPVWGVRRAPMTLCLSEDGGRSFPVRVNVEEGSGACLTNNSVDGGNREMSYPSLLQGSDGSLDLAYTFYRRAIRHVRLSSDWLEAQ